MQFRTDLVVETGEQLTQTAHPLPEGVERETAEKDNARITRIRITDDAGAQALGKPPGTYITVEVPPLSDNAKTLEAFAETIGAELTTLLPPEGTVLVVGLGNRSITPDALGPEAARMVLATRHIEGEFARSTGLDDLRPTVVLSPGVLGQTGVESGEVVRGLCDIVHPCAVIAIDALAARSVERLGCTVQLCDTGIAPGAGVGNNRKLLSRENLGVPVIGMGVPTVVDARTIAVELTGDERAEQKVTAGGMPMMVTPREIDLLIDRAARLVAMAVNAALQPDYSPAELISVAL